MTAHRLTNLTTTGAQIVNLRCPHCHHVGAFPGLGNCADAFWAESGVNYSAGMRVCPNPECQSLVFVILKTGKLDTSYPPQIIDFDSTNLPERILATLEEAIKAHGAGCFKASALMVRRLLEELCQDKNVAGSDLKARLASLGGIVVIPQELLGATDELRILGNDAAHVEAKAYDAIGPNEASLAIELAKELLKAVYQYAALVSKLKALRKP
jgi:Domain of unknown function (DUF4145)